MSDPMKERAKMLGESPAFPILQDTPFGSGHLAVCGTTLRAYLVAHAPAEPWPEFSPQIDEPALNVAIEPVGNDGEAPDEATKRALLGWKNDPCWDVEEDYPAYSCWVKGWKCHWVALSNHQIQHAIARRIQWPAFWADRMLEELAK